MSAINPNLGPEPVNRLTDGATRNRPMSRFELHTIFREAVRWELARGGLTNSQRRKLVQYAAALRISAVEAGQLMQEAVRAEREHVPPVEEQPPNLRLVTEDVSGWPTWAKLATVLGAVVLIKLTFAWLLR